MAKDVENDEDKGPGPPAEHLRPFVSYRNKEDDKIRKAFNELAKEREEKGLPMFGSPSRKEAKAAKTK